jgi:hypothetical protein
VPAAAAAARRPAKRTPRSGGAPGGVAREKGSKTAGA